jgi:hypothetical protein
MTKMLFRLAPVLALVAAPLSAQAEPTPRQIEAATRYALPHLFEGFVATCSDTLASDGYVMAQGDRLGAKFAQGADDAWPEAKQALLKIATQRGGDDADGLAMFAQLPDENLRPLVDGLLFAVVASELKQAQCQDVERGLALLDPLPVENIAGFAAFLFEMVGDDDAKGTPATNGSGAAG